MRSTILSIILSSLLASFAYGAEKWNRIVVDISKRTVSPADPVVNTASGSDVAISMVDGDKAVPIDAVLFRFPRTVYQYNDDGKLTPVMGPDGVKIAGPVLSLNFRTCGTLPEALRQLCPVIVVPPNRTPVVTVYSDDDGIEVFAEFSATKKFDESSTTRIPVLIGVVKRRASLSWSAGLAFFNQSDERWNLDAIPNNTEELKLVESDSASPPYRLSANANYMGLWGPPALGVSFGVAADVPFESLATTFGLTYTIRTLPIADSANFTIGLAYSPHKKLLPEYRGKATVPSGVAASGLTADEHDIGLFVGFSFNFAGGEEQFKTVFSGGGRENSGNVQ